jgi:hypothetical protein
MEKVLLGPFCGAGVVRGSFLQGATQSILGALALLRQTNRNACTIGMRWVRPTNINALREHGCRELSVVAPPGSGWRVASKNGSHGFLRIARTAPAFLEVECEAFYALVSNVTSLFRRDS